MTVPSSNVATPVSRDSSTAVGSAHQQSAKTAAAKDRPCPYCHINFTSSSLGRHLDLYIREKNPKPPDNVHDVEEIRRSRAGITRRHAKSGKKRSHQERTNGAHHESPKHESNSPSVSHAERAMGPMAFRSIFNKAHWTSTGVITDNDPWDANGESMTSPGVSSSGVDSNTRRRWTEERERGRAAELALQELVDSLKAAAAAGSIPEPFDFDFFSHSFPELCLRILPPPATLDRPLLMPGYESWPVDPPDETTLKLLERKVHARIAEWRETYYPPNPLKRRRTDNSVKCNSDDSIEPNPLFQFHLQTAWQEWSTLPLALKARDWQLSALRAFIREQELHIATKQRVEYLETELNRARLENARLTECQMPREWLHTPAAQLPLSKLAAQKVERELKKDGLDAEKLIAKWRPRVHAARSAARISEEAGTPHLSMVGPAGVPKETKRSDMNSFSYEGTSPTEDEDEDNEEDDDDEEDEAEFEDNTDSGNEIEQNVGTIMPSLRNQLEAFASC